MARRRPRINSRENYLPAMIATEFSPPTRPSGDTYQDLVDDGEIGINDDQVSSGETPLVLNLLLMGG
jgi:hypothetical protein